MQLFLARQILGDRHIQAPCLDLMLRVVGQFGQRVERDPLGRQRAFQVAKSRRVKTGQHQLHLLKARCDVKAILPCKAQAILPVFARPAPQRDRLQRVQKRLQLSRQRRADALPPIFRGHPQAQVKLVRVIRPRILGHMRLTHDTARGRRTFHHRHPAFEVMRRIQPRIMVDIVLDRSGRFWLDKVKHLHHPSIISGRQPFTDDELHWPFSSRRTLTTSIWSGCFTKPN